MKTNKAKISALMEGSNLRFEPPVSALSKWNPEVRAADSDDDSTINIYSSIGEDYWSGDGMTPKIVSAVLRRNKGKAITVNINSPGGSFFDGVAIYNLLREHDGEINVRVVGLAASAASIVAMAGDTIQIAESGFLMIHNAWTVAVGNKHDMAEAAETLEKFDVSMNGVYVKQTGISDKEIKKMMDAETWIPGSEAVERGFASALLDSEDVALDDKEKASYNSALRKADVMLAKAGVPRSERRELIKELTDKPRAVSEATPGAGDESELVKALASLRDNINKPTS